jgi:hypothetical protein
MGAISFAFAERLCWVFECHACRVACVLDRPCRRAALIVARSHTDEEMADAARKRDRDSTDGDEACHVSDSGEGLSDANAATAAAFKKARVAKPGGGVDGSVVVVDASRRASAAASALSLSSSRPSSAAGNYNTEGVHFNGKAFEASVHDSAKPVRETMIAGAGGGVRS